MPRNAPEHCLCYKKEGASAQGIQFFQISRSESDSTQPKIKKFPHGKDAAIRPPPGQGAFTTTTNRAGARHNERHKAGNDPYKLRNQADGAPGAYTTKSNPAINSPTTSKPASTSRWIIFSILHFQTFHKHFLLQ